MVVLSVFACNRVCRCQEWHLWQEGFSHKAIAYVMADEAPDADGQVDVHFAQSFFKLLVYGDGPEKTVKLPCGKEFTRCEMLATHRPAEFVLVKAKPGAPQILCPGAVFEFSNFDGHVFLDFNALSKNLGFTGTYAGADWFRKKLL